MNTYEKAVCMNCASEGYVKHYEGKEGLIAVTPNIRVVEYPVREGRKHKFSCEKCGGGIYLTASEKPTTEPEWV